MSSVNDSQGGYISSTPTQNNGVHPGAHSATYQQRQQRESNYPGNTTGPAASSASSSFSASAGLTITFTQSIVGAGGSISLSGDLGNSTVVVTNGAYSGTDWSISGTQLTLSSSLLVSLVSANSTLSYSGSSTVVKSPDGFPGSGFSGTATRRASGTSSADAGGSALSLLNSGVASSGNYWIKNVNGSSARELYCDMSTDGGGWTRFANKDFGTQSGSYDFQYATSDYNLSSFDTSSSWYVAFNHAMGRRTYSSGNYLEYLFEVKNGTYKFKMNSYYEGDPGVGNRGAANISGISSSHFDFGWFNNSSNGYWLGINSNTYSSCASSTNVVHYVSGNSGYNGGYFGVSRGYHSDCCTSSGCGDHCGNTRRYWQIFPYIGHQQHCFSGYYSLSGFDGGGRVSVSYRERGTLPAGAY